MSDPRWWIRNERRIRRVPLVGDLLWRGFRYVDMAYWWWNGEPVERRTNDK